MQRSVHRLQRSRSVQNELQSGNHPGSSAGSVVRIRHPTRTGNLRRRLLRSYPRRYDHQTEGLPVDRDLGVPIRNLQGSVLVRRQSDLGSLRPDGRSLRQQSQRGLRTAKCPAWGMGPGK
uniref:(northern house mosquito) hypothetical protein n=1 Tax=Culex pipiens TaxID=7175 RepID=A0A8D8F6P3_CULPI